MACPHGDRSESGLREPGRRGIDLSGVEWDSVFYGDFYDILFGRCTVIKAHCIFCCVVVKESLIDELILVPVPVPCFRSFRAGRLLPSFSHFAPVP